jgi:hypothetical protein
MTRLGKEGKGNDEVKTGADGGTRFYSPSVCATNDGVLRRIATCRLRLPFGVLWALTGFMAPVFLALHRAWVARDESSLLEWRAKI